MSPYRYRANRRHDSGEAQRLALDIAPVPCKQDHAENINLALSLDDANWLLRNQFDSEPRDGECWELRQFLESDNAITLSFFLISARPRLTIGCTTE